MGIAGCLGGAAFACFLGVGAVAADSAPPAAAPAASYQAAWPRAQPTASTRGWVDWQARQFVAEAQVLPYGNARLWQDVSRLGQALAEEELCGEFARLVAHLPLGCGAQTPAALLRQDPRWAAHLAGSVRHFVTTTTVYDADGRVTLLATLPFDGGKARLGALWSALWQRHVQLDVVRQGVLPVSRPATKAEVTRGLPTGFVVQAVGLEATRALWPRLVDAKGRELYGPGVLRPDVFAARGVAPFHTSLEEALHDPRVSERAVVLRAASVWQAGGSDFVLANDDAALLQEHLPLLQDGRVVFVVDGPGKPPWLR